MNHIVSGTQYFYTNLSLFLSLALENQRTLYIIYVWLTCAYVSLEHTERAIQHIATSVIVVDAAVVGILFVFCLFVSHLPLCQDPKRSFQLELVHYR